MRSPRSDVLVVSIIAAIVGTISPRSATAILTLTSPLARDSLFAPPAGSSHVSAAEAESQRSRRHAPWAPVPVCTAPSWRHVGSQVIPDGKQGAILAWYDARNESTELDIYAQRIGPSGEGRWTTNGVPVCVAPGEQYNEVMVSDGSAGAIVAWTDLRGPTGMSIYAQRVTENGTVAWTPDGVLLTDTDAVTPVIASDDQGGALVVWEDWTHGPRRIRAQRVTSSGRLLWGSSGVGICTVPVRHSGPKICSDGAGGAFVAWTDLRGSTPKVFVQHVSPSGAVTWADQGVPVCSVPSSQRVAGIVAESGGRATVIWADDRSRPPGYFGLFAQRLDSSNRSLWEAAGVALSEETVSEHLSLATLHDGDDLVALWHERRGTHFDTYGQRLDPLGRRLLGAGGIVLAGGPGDQIYPRATLDRDHGLFVAWTNARDYPYQFSVVVQHVDATGSPSWETGGIELAEIGGDFEQALVTDGRGGAFSAWVGCCGRDRSILAVRITDARSHVATRRALLPQRGLNVDGKLDASWSQSESSVLLALPRECDVDVTIHDVTGRMTKSLLRGRFAAGKRTIAWDLRDARGNAVPHGVFFASIRTSYGSRTVRIPIIAAAFGR